MSSYKNVVVVGASGSTGRIITEGLVSTSKFNVTVLSRQESTATFPEAVTIRTTDFSETDLVNALKGQDVVISALGIGGFEQQQKIVDAAVRAGIKRFLPSEFSSSSEDPAVLQLLPLFEQKKDLIQYLKSKEKDGLSWTALATGLLFDWGLVNGFLGFDIKKRTATIWDGGNKKFTLTNEKQLARAVVSVLEHPTETNNRYLYVYSVETAQNEILRSLEEASGSKWTIDRMSTDQQVAEAKRLLDDGDFGGGYILVRATTFGNVPSLRANYAKEENLANGLLGLEVESVEETVERVIG
ncbi:NmrA-like family protein [Fusarium austroafricanum]|uniref:NmrA-like family protein n=1 Tax=Fusarium austroafricanum TaxID=2364996 RepID=A0A8H4NS96_9HYPO|nr:NmrA-like family protein [Fusarium austroafricanum]